MSRARAFSAVAIATLALGIAGVTLMFTLVDGVLLRPWPVREQSRLIVAWKQLPASGFDLSLPQKKYADPTKHQQFLDESIARLTAEPSISAVTPVNVPPFAGIGGSDVPHFAAEGQEAARVDTNPPLNFESGLSRLLPDVRHRAAARPYLHRRRSTRRRPSRDRCDEVARAVWPEQDPIGKRLKMGGVDSRDPWLTVVGVAAATRYHDLTRPRPTLYVPAAQFLMTARTLVLRTTASPDEVARVAHAAMANVDRDVHVMRVRPFRDMLDAPLAGHRFSMRLAALFGIVALTLATVGLYAVIVASVRQRDREIGIRVALGASVSTVRRLVFGEGLRLAAIGAMIGAAGSLASTRLITKPPLRNRRAQSSDDRRRRVSDAGRLFRRLLRSGSPRDAYRSVFALAGRVTGCSPDAKTLVWHARV